MKKLRIAFLLTAVFALLFTGTFLTINFTQLGYSTPSKLSGAYGGSIGVYVAVGPLENSTNVPLDTTVVVYTSRNPLVTDLHLTPEVPIENKINVPVDDGLSGKTTFYLKEPLKPATTYNASVVVMNETVTWSFTTTTETLPLQSTIGRFITDNAFGVSLVIATIATSAVGITIWTKKNQ
jgi:hypothetical protein